MVKYVALMASLYVLNGLVNGLFIWTEIALLMALIPALKWSCLPVCVRVCVCICMCVCAAWRYRSFPPVCELWAHTELGMKAFLQDLWFPLFYELCVSVFQQECLPSLALWKTMWSPKQEHRSVFLFPLLPKDAPNLWFPLYSFPSI